MVRVFSSFNMAEVGLLKSLLEQDGIACTTRNEHLALIAGAIPLGDAMPQLWVVRDEDVERARELIAKWERNEPTTFDAWVCPRCSTQNEGQFGSCWQCGYDLP
jgi:hypothetical protein